MIIIVEGPDGAGKSTLIKQLLDSHPGSTMKHFSKPNTDEEALNYWQVYMDAVLEADPTKLTIFDRSWYSDLVYAPVMRHRDEMDIRHVKMLESLVVTHGGGYVIYMTATLNVLWKRCTVRGEHYVKTKEQLAALAQGYSDVFANACSLPVVRYDTTLG